MNQLLIVCVCVCARARMCVCVCVCVCARARARACVIFQTWLTMVQVSTGDGWMTDVLRPLMDEGAETR